jgi:hypothetical protein
MLTQNSVIDIVKALPKEFSIDELMDKLIVREKINQGQGDMKNGNFFNTQELVSKLEKWRSLK